MAYTMEETIGTASGAGAAFGNNSSSTYVAGKWTAAKSYALTQIGISFKRNGAPSTGTITGKVWVDNGSTAPDSTTVATAVNAINLADLTDAFTEYLFQFASPFTITSGLTYWLGGIVSVINATHYTLLQYGTYNAADNIKQSSAGVTWGNLLTRKAVSWTYSTIGSDLTPTIVPVVLTGIAPTMNFGIVTRAAIRGG